MDLGGCQCCCLGWLVLCQQCVVQVGQYVVGVGGGQCRIVVGVDGDFVIGEGDDGFCVFEYGDGVELVCQQVCGLWVVLLDLLGSVVEQVCCFQWMGCDDVVGFFVVLVVVMQFVLQCGFG